MVWEQADNSPALLEELGTLIAPGSWPSLSICVGFHFGIPASRAGTAHSSATFGQQALATGENMGGGDTGQAEGSTDLFPALLHHFIVSISHLAISGYPLLSFCPARKVKTA